MTTVDFIAWLYSSWFAMMFNVSGEPEVPIDSVSPVIGRDAPRTEVDTPEGILVFS
jgi:hypothetical protein